MAHVIAVFGTTGNQGGSVARSLLGHPPFKVRAITRNPSSNASQALASAGAEVVKANSFDRSEIVAAIRGAWGAFVNTNSNDPAFSKPEGPTELDLGKTIIDGIAEAGVEHLVFSSGMHVRR